MDETRATPEVRGGRGARARIVAAAGNLFYEQGISSTGMKQLTDAAHVSTRSFYQHFASKDALVAEYLTRWDTDRLLANEAALDDTSRPPAVRLRGLFAPPPAGASLRGCPFHNAAVEGAALDDAARAIVVDHKQRFLATVVAATREAHLRSPKELGYQLAVLYEGAAAWSTSAGDPTAFRHAGRAATVLIQQAGAQT